MGAVTVQVKKRSMPDGSWPEESSSKWLVPLHSREGWEDKDGRSPEELVAEREHPEPEPPEPRPLPTWEVMEPFLERIPPVEADMVRLRAQGMTQDTVAFLFGVSQQAVKYRLQRARLRIQWLATVPRLDGARFQGDLGLVLTDRQTEVLEALWKHGSQSRAARSLYGDRQGSTGQSSVRVHLLAALAAMRRAVETGHPSAALVAPYLAYFSDLVDNRRWGLAAESGMADRFPHVRRATVHAVGDPPTRKPRASKRKKGHGAGDGQGR